MGVDSGVMRSRWKLLECLPGTCKKVDKRQEFLRDKERVKLKLNEKLKAIEMRQYRPLRYQLSEL